MSIQDLDSRFPIVKPDGTPTDYFLHLLKDRGRSQVTAENSLNDTVDTLDELIEVVEDLALDDLTDVDVATTPPTNQQVLSFDDSDNLWKPRTVSGGAGGSIAAYVQWTGGASPSIQASFNVASVTRTTTGRFRITFTDAMSDEFYPICGMARFSDSTNDLVPRIGVDRRTGQGKATTHVDITINTDTASTTDGYDWVSVTVFETPS